MHIERMQNVNKITNSIEAICSDFLVDKQYSDPIEEAIGITKEQTYDIIKRVLNGLPVKYFYASPKLISEINDVITKNFILFQAQEDIRNDDYTLLLNNFIHHVARLLNKQYPMLTQH